MKRLFLLFAIAFVSAQVFAQIPHGDMESWRTYTSGSASIENPNGWFSYDSLTFAVGPTAYPGAIFNRQTFKSSSAHAGNYAAMIMSRQQDTLAVAPGILVNAQPEVNIPALLANPSNPYAAIFLTGGTAVTQRIASINAWIKYLPRSGDNGEILVEAHKKFGSKDSVIGRGDVSVTAMSAYTNVRVDISYNDTFSVPQTMIINFLSTAIGNIGVDSSTMYVDDVAMTAVDVANVHAQKEIVACYPNPSNGIVNLVVPAGKKLYWQLNSVNGERIDEREISGHIIADLSYLPNGVYIYNISDENGVIVQRGKLSVVK